MENTTNFVDETDYKMLWEYQLKRYAELEEQLQMKNDEIERWQREVETLNDAASKLEATIEKKDKRMSEMNDVIQRLNGELTAFRFVICNLGVGD